MSIRQCLRWPDRRLRGVAEPVGEITAEIHALWRDMVDTMVAMPGVGLAAPQIGVMLRLAVVDASGTGKSAVLLANPELIEASAELREYTEASPNLPGVSAMLERAAEVEVAYTDQRGMRIRKRFKELWATSVQHQLDHLDGRMYFDRLGPVKRRMLLARAKKRALRR